ncbi:hypothetical protein MiSe_89820 [Microseira wollei NIES-4236]|uniref:Uncharacterized protein n=1 Tax=Microseira wollei NIES-4236 TaxID=2530354 RepID=A0AAV3XSP1_9CYAN|nr:hypothetical protein MiSe_89820 [Microseira wollei NIES-4236]
MLVLKINDARHKAMPRKPRRFPWLNQSLPDPKGIVGSDGRLAKYVDFITGKTDFNINKTV